MEPASVIKPGVLRPVLSALQTLDEKEYMLCIDAKKVTAGIALVEVSVLYFNHLVSVSAGGPQVSEGTCSQVLRSTSVDLYCSKSTKLSVY